ncbi:DUF1877 family protein [Subtercola boreus]|uniref:DUF1877 family protein n=1 Tax=Subtercola boreus TaxID=120213 RepID=UPI00147650C8|nr:DUF1877 family protein [Subtercola boreus]
MDAIYTAVRDDILTEIRGLAEDELTERVFALSEIDHAPELHLSTSWDGLHFLLSGTSARGALPAGSALSEGIVGAERLWGGGVNWVAATSRQSLPTVLSALSAVEPSRLSQAFEPHLFRRAGIYPVSGWSDRAISDALPLYLERLDSLIRFYSEVVAEGGNVIVEVG